MALRTIVLTPGECAILPSTATVEAIVVDGSATYTATCDGLPAPTVYKCWKFEWEESSSGALQDAVFTSLIIGSNIYNVPEAYNDYNNESLLSTLKLADWMSTDPNLEGIVKVGCSDVVGDYTLKIQIPEGLSAPVLKISNPYGGGNQILSMEAVEDNDCETC